MRAQYIVVLLNSFLYEHQYTKFITNNLNVGAYTFQQIENTNRGNRSINFNIFSYSRGKETELTKKYYFL